MRRMLTAAALMAAVLAANGPTRAEEYNQRPFLGPGEMSKVQRVISHGRAERFRQEGVADSVGTGPNASIVNTGCGKLSVGNVETTGRPGERLPRENIVIAREIINAPINCGTRGRR